MGERDCRLYEGLERREPIMFPCPLHEIFTKGIEKDLKAGETRMQRFEQKIDELLLGQVKINLEIQAMQHSIGNGLSKDVRVATKCIEKLETEFSRVCSIYDEKFIEVDNFQWFRTWANGLKNKTVAVVLTITVAGGLAMSVVLSIIYLVMKIKDF